MGRCYQDNGSSRQMCCSEKGLYFKININCTHHVLDYKYSSVNFYPYTYTHSLNFMTINTLQSLFIHTHTFAQLYDRTHTAVEITFTAVQLKIV